MEDLLKTIENQILFLKCNYPSYLEDCWMHVQDIKRAADLLETMINEQYPEWEKNRKDIEVSLCR